MLGVVVQAAPVQPAISCVVPPIVTVSIVCPVRVEVNRFELDDSASLSACRVKPSPSAMRRQRPSLAVPPVSISFRIGAVPLCVAPVALVKVHAPEMVSVSATRASSDPSVISVSAIAVLAKYVEEIAGIRPSVPTTTTPLTDSRPARIPPVQVELFDAHPTLSESVSVLDVR